MLQESFKFAALALTTLATTCALNGCGLVRLPSNDVLVKNSKGLNLTPKEEKIGISVNITDCQESSTCPTPENGRGVALHFSF